VRRSLVYRSPALYDLAMRGLYRRHARARLAVVAELVPERVSVLELCCGPGALYQRHLRDRGVQYLGLDVNQRFVAAVRRAGGRAQVRDVADGAALPAADVVIIQAALYHFLPDPEPLVERMLSAACQRVIVSEPVRNLASSSMPVVATLARRLADPGTGAGASRFDERTLDELMERFTELVRAAFLTAGGRDKVFVLEPERQPS
jgi:SAM-dependent methyltransferase